MAAAAWSERFDQTWLAHVASCRAIDAEIARILRRHRGDTVGSILIVETTASTIRDAGRQVTGAMTCTAMLALVGELLLCAESGGLLDKAVVATFAAGDRDRHTSAEAMRLLRNSVCHPASVNPAHGEVAVLGLLDLVESEFRDDVWTPIVRVNLTNLSARDVTLFALRLVDNIGYRQAERWKLRGFRKRTAHTGHRS